MPVRSYHCQSSTAVCRCCLAVTGDDDQKQFVQRNRRRNALDGYLLKVVSDSRWLMKMTVETVFSRKVTLREDVLALMRNGMGWECLKSASVQEARRTTLAEDSAHQGLRQDSFIRWQGGIKEEIRLRWPCYRKNLMTGKSIAPVRRSNRGARRRLGRRGREGSDPLCS